MMTASEFWTSVGRAGGWRLIDFSGMDAATFLTRAQVEISIPHQFGEILLQWSELLDEVMLDAEDLAVEIDMIVTGRDRKIKVSELKEAGQIARRIMRKAAELRTEHPYMFPDMSP